MCVWKEQEMFNDYYINLTDGQWNALMNVSRISKMDCWFCLMNDEYGDYVLDAEEGMKRMKIQDGIGQLFEGITDYDWSRLTEEDQKALNELSKELFDEVIY